MLNNRFAVIDCGTNTFNLLIAEKTVRGWKFLFRSKRVVKLGSQGIKDGIIGPIPYQKALNALIDYRQICDSYEAKSIRAYGTAALRDAKNGKKLLRDIYKQTGFKVLLIDGNEEARLIYLGVKEALNIGDSCSLIMDIGGGSTEFILCNNQQIYWKKSFRLGAARLLEILQPGDPIRKSETDRLSALLTIELASLIKACEKYNPIRLIGSSGSFDTFAAIILKAKNLHLGKATHYQFNLSEYKSLHRQLLKSTYKERIHIPGMLRMRADMIVLASLLLTFVLRSTKVKELHLSTYALKEGVLASILTTPVKQLK